MQGVVRVVSANAARARSALQWRLRVLCVRSCDSPATASTSASTSAGPRHFHHVTLAFATTDPAALRPHTPFVQRRHCAVAVPSDAPRAVQRPISSAPPSDELLRAQQLLQELRDAEEVPRWRAFDECAFAFCDARAPMLAIDALTLAHQRGAALPKKVYESVAECAAEYRSFEVLDQLASVVAEACPHTGAEDTIAVLRTILALYMRFGRFDAAVDTVMRLRSIPELPSDVGLRLVHDTVPMVQRTGQLEASLRVIREIHARASIVPDCGAFLGCLRLCVAAFNHRPDSVAQCMRDVGRDPDLTLAAALLVAGTEQHSRWILETVAPLVASASERFTKCAVASVDHNGMRELSALLEILALSGRADEVERLVWRFHQHAASMSLPRDVSLLTPLLFTAAAEERPHTQMRRLDHCLEEIRARGAALSFHECFMACKLFGLVTRSRKLAKGMERVAPKPSNRADQRLWRMMRSFSFYAQAMEQPLAVPPKKVLYSMQFSRQSFPVASCSAWLAHHGKWEHAAHILRVSTLKESRSSARLLVTFLEDLRALKGPDAAGAPFEHALHESIVNRTLDHCVHADAGRSHWLHVAKEELLRRDVDVTAAFQTYFRRLSHHSRLTMGPVIESLREDGVLLRVRDMWRLLCDIKYCHPGVADLVYRVPFTRAVQVQRAQGDYRMEDELMDEIELQLRSGELELDSSQPQSAPGGTVEGGARDVDLELEANAVLVNMLASGRVSKASSFARWMKADGVLRSLPLYYALNPHLIGNTEEQLE